MYAATVGASGDVRVEDPPSSGAAWTEYARLAVTFEPPSRDSCSEFAAAGFSRWVRTGELPRGLDDLRGCLWFEQRRWRFLGRDPDPQGMRYCGALVRAMRAAI
ncbi:MAG: hypothetical protein WAQ33_12710 [Gaiellaceae bacterium]